MVLYTVPVLYEKYEDKVDAFGEKAMVELKKYYAIFEEKCLSKIPKCIRRVESEDGLCTDSSYLSITTCWF
jgi:hypothetical protein